MLWCRKNFDFILLLISLTFSIFLIQVWYWFISCLSNIVNMKESVSEIMDISSPKFPFMRILYFLKIGIDLFVFINHCKHENIGFGNHILDQIWEVTVRYCFLLGFSVRMLSFSPDSVVFVSDLFSVASDLVVFVSDLGLFNHFDNYGSLKMCDIFESCINIFSEIRIFVLQSSFNGQIVMYNLKGTDYLLWLWNSIVG